MSAPPTVRVPAAAMPVVRTRPTEGALARRRRLAGVVYLVVPALLVWLSIAVYEKEFTDSATVIVETGRAGSEMHPSAEVKLRGVVVGEVEKIDTGARTARLTLALQPDKIGRVPSDVRAQLLPTTLFGQRYVALVPPEHPSARPLTAGSVIPQDRSRSAVELEQVLDNLLPLLTAVQPRKHPLGQHCPPSPRRPRRSGRSKIGDPVVDAFERLPEGLQPPSGCSPTTPNRCPWSAAAPATPPISGIRWASGAVTRCASPACASARWRTSPWTAPR
ncbi:hypothetical protein SALBM135S_08529 [Streptomyces alboniger]